MTSLVLTARLLNAQIPDSSFGVNGIVRYGFSNSYHSELQKSVLHPDGKISSVGFSGAVGFTSHILLSRHLSSGALDSSFNGDGSLVFSFGGNNEQARSLALLQNGNVMVGGVSNGKPVLAVLKPDGSFDAAFSNSGIKWIDLGIGNGGRINKIIQQTDGKILAMGYGYNGFDFDMMVCRMLTNGDLDTGWAQNGIGLYPTGTYHNFCNDAALQSNGKLVIAGYSSSASDYVTVMRLTSNGLVDSSFGVNGRYHQNIGSSINELAAVQILSNDDLLLAGSISGSPLSTIDHLTIKLKSNGSTDHTFGNMGVSINDVRNTEDQTYGLHVNSDGSFFQSGFSYNTSGITEFVCFKCKQNGSIDSSFGVNGIYIFPFAGNGWIKSILKQSDGKLLFCGQSSSTLASMGEFTLLRLKSTVANNVNEHEMSIKGVTIYPNPSMSFLNVRCLPCEQNPMQILLGDNSGKMILKKWIQQNERLDLSGLKSGIYQISIFCNEQLFKSLFLKN